MGAQQEESEPLVAPTVPDAYSGLRKQPTGHVAMAVQDGSQSAQREWDGRLLDCCGNCDPNGVSTFAYVKYCTPLAWGHNMKRAFNASFWKHAILFALLFGAWWWLYIGFASQAGMVCGPEPPPHHKEHDHWAEQEPWKKETFEEGPKTAEEQTFLAGATWQPENFEPLPEGPLLDLTEPVSVDGQGEAEQQIKEAQETAGQAAEIAREKAAQAVKEAQEQLSKTLDASKASEQLNDQVQWAKQQVADGMAQLNAQLGVGRKLLHKHDHDDDEDEDDEDHHKKKDKKHKDKKGKDKKSKDKHRDEKHHPKDDHHHGPPPEFGPDSPACRAAQKSVLIMWGIAVLTAIVGVHYAARMRTAIRERFGIPGSRMKDCLAWMFCGPCALCQETRTLATNNVHSGIWFGPTMLAVPAHPLQAPEQQAAEKPAKGVEDAAAKV